MSTRSIATAVLVILSACGTERVRLDGTQVTVASVGASNPTVAIDPASGAVFVAWVATTASETNVHLARIEGGHPTAPIRVNDRPGDAAAHAQAPAQVAVGPEGNVYVLWQNSTPVEGRRFPASDLRFARSTDGARTFARAIYVNDDAGGPPASHTFHDIAVARDGAIYVSWIDGRVSAGAHGDHGSHVRVARSRDGGRSFESSVVVGDSVCPCCRTTLGIAVDGAVVVAWRKIFPGDIRDIVTARSSGGALSFDSSQLVHGDGWVVAACPHAGPAVAVDQRGRTHVAWFTGAEGRAGVYYAAGTASFGRPARLTPEGPASTSQVAMASDGGDGAWLAWEEHAGRPSIALGRVRGEGRVLRVIGEPLSGQLPAIDATTRTLAVAWLDGDAVRALIAPLSHTEAAGREPGG